jgi:thioredoxin-dependent peroxiredoxin
MKLKKGLPAPDFSLKDDEGKTRVLSEFKGTKVVLYFYPKDDTPGCTTEACNFRDDYSSYIDAGITILGVSPDSVDSHEKFRKKFHLPFSLLADEDHKISEAYGVWGKKKFMGKEYMGVLRTTFVINEIGRIAHVFEDVKPAEHSNEILALL